MKNQYLRDYQNNIVNKVIGSKTDDLVQLDTGGGKTRIMSAIIDNKPTICIAHRNMLVEQISSTLTSTGIAHKVLANNKIVKRCELLQRDKKLGNQQCYVASLLTLISRAKRGEIDASLDYKIIIDEAHHCAAGNSWTKLKNIFKNAQFVGFTATPCRLDGKGLSKDNGGLFDRLVQADSLTDNSVAKLIGGGYLSDYDYYAPPTDIKFKALKMSSTGDYTQKSLDKSVRGLEICADIIKAHKKYADGRRTLVFCVSIAIAKDFVNSFVKAGYSATYIASDLTTFEVVKRLDAFRSGEIEVLCNVNMVTEGFDLPEIDAIQIVRPTASLGLHRQMIGRVLRPKAGKAIIIDHVGNVLKHGLPDDNIHWSIDSIATNKSSHTIICKNCHKVYSIYKKVCPFCGADNWILQHGAGNNPFVVAGVIPIELVRQARAQAAREEQKAAYDKAMELKWHNFYTIPTPFERDFGSDLIGRTCQKLATFIYRSLKDNITPREINIFTHHGEVDRYFILQHFTIFDVKNNDVKKCIKIAKTFLATHKCNDRDFI